MCCTNIQKKKFREIDLFHFTSFFFAWHDGRHLDSGPEFFFKNPCQKTPQNKMHQFDGIFGGGMFSFFLKVKFLFFFMENVQKIFVKLIHYISRVYWSGLF